MHLGKFQTFRWDMPKWALYKKAHSKIKSELTESLKREDRRKKKSTRKKEKNSEEIEKNQKKIGP